MNPSTAHWRRRWLLLTVLVVMTAAVGGWWVWDHLRPRDASLSAPRRPIATVRLGSIEVHDGFVGQTVRVTDRDGRAVDFRVVRPARPDRPLPLVVILGGLETGSHAVDLVGDPGRMAVAALEYPYAGPRHPRGWREVLATVPLAQQALLDTPPAVSLAVDWLTRQPWIDRRRIELVGVSLGVPFAAAAGALDHRFGRVWLIHGAAGNRDLFEHSLCSRIASPFLRARAADLLYLLSYGPTLEPARWVPRIAPRPVIVIGAADDERLPREGTEALFAAARPPRELLWTQGRHLEPGRAAILGEIVTLVRRRLASVRPAAPDRAAD